MTVQIITDERTARRRFIDLRETATGSQVSTDGYSTVSIPDLRSRKATETTEEKNFRYDGAHQPFYASKLPTLPEVEFMTSSANADQPTVAPTGGAVSSLETIRNSIGRAIPTTDVDQADQKIELGNLAEELGKPTQESEINQATADVDGDTCQGNVCMEAFDDAGAHIDSMVESIRSINTHRRPVIVSIASSETNDQLPSILIGVAKALIKDSDKPVLVVDSDFENNQVTESLNAGQISGASELTSEKTDWREVITETSVDGLGFLPVGKKRVTKYSHCETAIGRVVRDCIDQFGLVLVNVGDAHGKAANIWSKHTDGSYLLISMKNSNKAVAKSAVTQLNSHGARLIGCIASDGSEI